MKRILAFIVPFLICCGACESGSPEGQEQAPAAEATPPVEAADEDEIIMRLSGELIASPDNQAERDHNRIVNYAIDSLLDVRATRSGLFYQIREPGSGEPIEWGDKVRVHYRGYFLDSGKVFDSSYRRGEPIEFYVGNMIDGWNEGLQLLRPGARALFLAPSHLAYGEEGVKNSRGEYVVPPDEVLAFELVVLEVVERREEGNDGSD